VDVRKKVAKLHGLLADYGKVGIAFSGGVDSSFLVKSALDVLGPDHVVILHGRSCLQKSEEQQMATSWLSRHGYQDRTIQIQVVDLQPLSWSAMVANGEDRCYCCKHQMYSLFLKKLTVIKIPYLLDGTNIDDCSQHRPGLQAIQELGVQTPLADSGLGKQAIRLLSHQLHLDTWDIPSSSCLATRIPHGLEITNDRLKRIALWEQELTRKGFAGCRVRMDYSGKTVYLQVLRKDLKRIVNTEISRIIIQFFNGFGIEHVHINSQGR